MKRLAFASVFAACSMLLGQSAALAQDDPTTYTRESFTQWLNVSKAAKPDFKVGDTLGHADLEKIRPFLFPGYFEQYQKWTDVKFEIVETNHVTPHQMVLDCNEKFQSRSRWPRTAGFRTMYAGILFPMKILKRVTHSPG